MGKKKEIEIQHEFIKFIQTLYKDEIQLNMMDSFDISNDGTDVSIFFPKNKYFKMVGTLNLDTAPKLKEWFLKKPSSIHIDNNVLDEVRKRKMGDFVSVDTTDDTYSINFTDGKTFTLTRSNPFKLMDTFDFKYNVEIPAERLNKNVLTLYFKNGKILFKNMQESEVLFDIAVKSIQNVFKKDATYKLYATDKNDEGFRFVMLEAKGNMCSLSQYFKVI